METYTMSDFQRKSAELAEAALMAPVSITRNGREKYVLLNTEEYKRLKRKDREVLSVDELSQNDIRDIAAAEMPEEYAYLDELLDQDS